MAARKVVTPPVPSIGNLVTVEWYDAFAAASDKWTPLEEIDVKHRPIQTVGHEILGLTDEYVVIAQSYDKGTACVDHVTVIPVGMVQTIKIIK